MFLPPLSHTFSIHLHIYFSDACLYKLQKKINAENSAVSYKPVNSGQPLWVIYAKQGEPSLEDMAGCFHWQKKKMQNRISLRLPFQFPGSHTFHQCPRFNRRHSVELGIQVVLRFSHLQNSIPNFVFINLSSEASAENSFSQGRHGNFPVIYAELELGIQTPELILFFPYFCSTIRSNWPVVVGVLQINRAESGRQRRKCFPKELTHTIVESMNSRDLQSHKLEIQKCQRYTLMWVQRSKSLKNQWDSQSELREDQSPR